MSSEIALVFTIVLDPTLPKTSTNDYDYNGIILDKNDFGDKNRWIAMRSTMDEDVGNGYLFIDLLYEIENNDDSKRRVYYIRVNPMDTNDIYGQSVSHNEYVWGNDGIFFGSATGTIGSSNTFTGYEAYYAAGVKKFATWYDNQNIDLKKSSI